MRDLRRNVELKAHDLDPDRSRLICRELGAEDHGELWQRDTYFGVPVGRLKLREQHPGSAHLIQYVRESRPEQRESRYRVIAVPEPVEMVAALTDSVGVQVVVEKHRRLFLHGPVRIHLDVVQDLGCFLEFEAVAPESSDLEHEHQLIDELRRAFKISDDQLIATGYADQLAIATAGRIETSHSTARSSSRSAPGDS